MKKSLYNFDRFTIIKRIKKKVHNYNVILFKQLTKIDHQKALIKIINISSSVKFKINIVEDIHLLNFIFNNKIYYLC